MAMSSPTFQLQDLFQLGHFNLLPLTFRISCIQLQNSSYSCFDDDILYILYAVYISYVLYLLYFLYALYIYIIYIYPSNTYLRTYRLIYKRGTDSAWFGIILQPVLGSDKTYNSTPVKGRASMAFDAGLYIAIKSIRVIMWKCERFRWNWNPK